MQLATTCASASRAIMSRSASSIAARRRASHAGRPSARSRRLERRVKPRPPPRLRLPLCMPGNPISLSHGMYHERVGVTLHPCRQA